VPAAQAATVASAVAVQALVTRCPGPAVEHAVQALVCVPSAEYVLAAHDAMTASAEAEHCVVTRCPGPAVEQGGQAPVWLPATENVPEAQAATTALAVAVQALVTRCPGPAVEQAEQVVAPATAKVPAAQGMQVTGRFVEDHEPSVGERTMEPVAALT